MSTVKLSAIPTPAPVPPAPAPRSVPHVIADDAEALAAATRLAAQFRQGASERDRNRRHPWEELEDFVASGLWSITIPKEYGGPGVSNATLAQVIALIAAADGSLSQIPQNHYYALEVLRVGGSEEQKRFFYDRVLKGERTGNALAEIGHRDFKRRTRLWQESGKWFVEGQKFYCTGAIYAHWIPTLVIAEEEGKPVSYLVFIPRTAPGVTIIDDWDGFGQRITGSGSVQFERVAIEPTWIVPFQASFDRPTTIGPVAQIMHAAIDLGIGQGAYDETLNFIRTRARRWIDSTAESAATDPLTLSEAGNVHVRLKAAHLMLARAGRIADAAQRDPTVESVAAASIAVAEAKILSNKVGLLAANKLFELSGTSAALGEDNYDRFWRNVRTHSVHDPIRWKYQAVGKYYLKDELPPRHGAI